MLHGIDASAVKVEGFHPPQGISDHLFGCLTVLPVDIGHVGRELTVEPVFCPIAVSLTANATRVEPVRVVLDVLVVFMDVVDHVIHHHTHAIVVGRFDHGLKFGLRPQSRFNPTCLDGPIAVEGRHIVHTVRCFARPGRSRVERGEPEGIDAEVGKVARLNHLRDAGKISTLPVRPLGSTRAGTVVTGVAVDKTVGHDHVNQGVLPDEISVRPGPERDQEVVGRMSVGVKSFDLHRVLPVLKAGQRKRPCRRHVVPRGASQRGGNTVVKRTGGAGMVGYLEGNIRQGGGVVGAQVIVHTQQRVLDVIAVHAFWIARVEDVGAVNDEFVAV